MGPGVFKEVSRVLCDQGVVSNDLLEPWRSEGQTAVSKGRAMSCDVIQLH